METAEDFLAGGLAQLGIEADEMEMGVVAAAHQLFWPAILELLALELDDGAAEATQDLSRAP